MATAADLMTPDIPRSDRHRTVGETIAGLRGHAWDEVGHVYLVDDQAVLTGQVPIERLLQAKEQATLAELEGLPPIEVLPGDGAETVALAFFLPLVVYMADAVGTQTETVLVRRLAYGEVELWAQLVKETFIGVSIGTIVAVVAAAGLWIWNGHPALAVVVGASLGVTAVVATVMASLLPLGLVRLGADPALASGPVATVVQDILSVGIYLMIATALLPR